MSVIKKSADKLAVEIHPDRTAMGNAAAAAVIAELKTILAEHGTARMIFAAAPSQNEVLDALVSSAEIDWSKITAFNMDEYIGLPSEAPQRFSSYLNKHIFSKVPFAAVNAIMQDKENPQQTCDEYAALLSEKQIDIVCMGVGENGHIAFNDPPVADFNDPKLIKIVDLDLECRQQQVNDGCFSSIDAVPKQAVTLTIPMLLSAKTLICSVPGIRKRNAVKRMLTGSISTECPATILRNHRNCTLFVDADCLPEF
ncbi:glucosamine-6-phosphate deaminase [Planctomycetales bacterium]|nr:glucosamine-6-phosphate deaminase [Planctomycetales bacterium]